MIPVRMLFAANTGGPGPVFDSMSIVTGFTVAIRGFNSAGAKVVIQGYMEEDYSAYAILDETTLTEPETQPFQLTKFVDNKLGVRYLRASLVLPPTPNPNIQVTCHIAPHL